MADELFKNDIIQKFNSTEITIYKYLLSNAEKICYMTIRELAAEMNVSTSTILGFCAKLDCESYKTFKAEQVVLL